MEELVITFAFAIDDPCGAAEIRLARTLIEFARSIPERDRMMVAEEIQTMLVRIRKSNEVENVGRPF
jgi:hypothetical protein